MNHVEMKALCCYMGLTPNDVADILKDDLQLVNKWWCNEQEIPELVANEIKAWADWVNQSFSETLIHYKDSVLERSEGSSLTMQLLWYSDKPPALGNEGESTPHVLNNAVTALLCATLNSLTDSRVILSEFNYDAYTDWRKDKGYADTIDNRHQWVRSLAINS